MRHCSINGRKSNGFLFLAVLISLFLLTGIVVSAEQTIASPEFVMISEGGFGDPQNNYAWSVSEFKGDLYVGTGRNIPYFVAQGMKAKGVFPENLTLPELTHPSGQPIPQLWLPNQSPASKEDVINWSNDMRAEIWRLHDGEWSQVHQATTFVNPMNGYTYPEGIGYRIMSTFTDSEGTEAIYAGEGFGFGRILLIRSTDGMTWVPVNTSSIPSRDTRAMIPHAGKLYLGTPEGIFVSANPSPLADTWVKVADFQVASLESFDGYLYAGTGNGSGPSTTNGFEVWKSTTESPTGPGDWVKIVSGGAGDAWNVLAGTIRSYEGDVYVGSMNLPFATGSEGVKGFDLIRINTLENDTWDLIVGNYRPKIPTEPRGPPLSGWPSGYANPFNLYAWSIEEYDGNLYLGTFDIFSLARYIEDVPGGYEILLDALSSRESSSADIAGGESGTFLAELSNIDTSGDPEDIIPIIELLAWEFGGADLWRSSDGVAWAPVDLNGFGDPDNYGFRTMLTTDDSFIIGTANPFNGCQIWVASNPPEEPPASVTNLHNTTFEQDLITWNWTDPCSHDFSHVMVWIDGEFEENVTRESETYTETELEPATAYTISTRTVGMNGLINETWVNQTSWTKQIAPPVADFTANITSGDIPLAVQFTDNSTGDNITSWLWTFGDNETSNESDPVHVYTNAGSYTVTLLVENDGGSNSTTRTNYIVATNAIPVPDFTGVPRSGSAPLDVAFTDSSTGVVTTRLWEFGDGTSEWSNGTPSVSHTYPIPGTYSVSLTVGNEAGDASITKPAYIQVRPSGIPPFAYFTASPVLGYAPMTVHFTDRSSGTPIRWEWTFGDGNTSADRNPTHVYTAVGRFIVTLKVSNSGGSSSYSSVVYVRTPFPYSFSPPVATPMTTPVSGRPPIAFFAVNDTSGTAPMSVKCTDISFNSPTNWSWNFGDGHISTVRNPVNTFTEPGTYSITLTVKNSYGESTASRRVNVR